MSLVKTRNGIVITDVIIFLTLYLLPGLSHLMPFPLFLIEPMRIAVLTAYLLNRNLTNGLALALTIPLFSSLTTGHPLFLKALLISLELSINLGLIYLFINKVRINVFLSTFVAILLSKAFYYAAKFLILKVGLLEGKLVLTHLWPQFYLSVGLAILFGILYRVTQKHYRDE